MIQHDTIAVVDFGGQYAHLIATKVRRLRVLAEIRQPEDPIEAFADYKGIILSGSPSLSAFGEDSGYTKAIYDLDVPILGFCFGHQEIAKHYGGTGRPRRPRVGPRQLCTCVREHPLFAGLGPVEPRLDEPLRLGRSASAPASRSSATRVLGEGERAGTASPPSGRTALRRYGFQFHPEVDDTRARRRDDRQLRPAHLRLPPVVDDGALPRGAGGARAARRWATARSSCSRRAASTRRSPRGCSRWRSAPTACTCCTWTTA